MAFLAALLFLLAFAIFSTAFDVATADEPKPIVPWNRPAEIVDRKHGFGQAIDGMVGQLQGQLRQMGADAMQKLEALKQAMPAKFQELMEKAVQIFRGPSASEKEPWDKLIKTVESTNLSSEEKREFYEKVAAATVQQIH